MNNLKHFIIGSSLPVIILHYFLVYYNKKKKYSYFTYTILAPLYLGLVNVISHNVFKKINLQNLLILSFISANFIFGLSYFTEKYDFNEREWRIYYFKLNILHFYLYNIIYAIDGYLFRKF